MKRKCIGIIMAVLIVALIATFSMSGCKNTTLAGTASAATTNTTNAGTATAAVTTSTTNAGTSAAVISAAGYVGNIAEKALGNSFFREVVFTGKYSQLVVMSLKPGEEIGTETHPNVDQFFRVEKGSAKVIINGVESLAPDGTGIVVPAGSEHNIINSSTSSDLKLYTVYSPPNHKDGVIHKTKIDAEADTTDIVDSTLTINTGTAQPVISAAGYVGNIAEKALSNSYFREVVFTGKYSQLVVMSLKPGEEIGTETHPNVDQFFRVEKGSAKVIINGVESLAPDGTGIVVPAGSEHNIINLSTSSDLKLYTVYSPPNHKDGVIHKTKIDAEADTTDIVGSPYITN